MKVLFISSYDKDLFDRAYKLIPLSTLIYEENDIQPVLTHEKNDIKPALTHEQNVRTSSLKSRPSVNFSELSAKSHLKPVNSSPSLPINNVAAPIVSPITSQQMNPNAVSFTPQLPIKNIATPITSENMNHNGDDDGGDGGDDDGDDDGYDDGSSYGSYYEDPGYDDGHDDDFDNDADWYDGNNDTDWVHFNNNSQTGGRKLYKYTYTQIINDDKIKKFNSLESTIKCNYIKQMPANYYYSLQDISKKLPKLKIGDDILMLFHCEEEQTIYDIMELDKKVRKIYSNKLKINRNNISDLVKSKQDKNSIIKTDIFRTNFKNRHDNIQ